MHSEASICIPPVLVSPGRAPAGHCGCCRVPARLYQAQDRGRVDNVRETEGGTCLPPLSAVPPLHLVIL